jgi:hypothetical protein
VHLAAVDEVVATGRGRGLRAFLVDRRGAAHEAATSNLDAADVLLLRSAPDWYVIGQLPALLAFARSHLRPSDERLLRLQALADFYAGPPPVPKVVAPVQAPSLRHRAAAVLDAAARPRPADRCAIRLCDIDREAIAAAYDAAAAEARSEVGRVRSFRNVLYFAAAALFVAVVGLIVATAIRPSLLPLCFTPVNTAVCPMRTGPPGGAVALADTLPGRAAALEGPGSPPDGEQAINHAEILDRVMRKSADGWDVALIELIGGLAAAVSAAFALRTMNGTTTPYSLPLALAVLKVPTGALTAVIGLLLLRGGFVPGFSNLDDSGQIVAWAVVFGGAQQLVTRLVDQRAEVVLDKVGTPGTTKAPDGTTKAPEGS